MRAWPTISPRITFDSASMALLGTPKNYRNVFIDLLRPMNGEQRDMMDRINWMLTSKSAPKTFIVCGGNGTGKTYIGSGAVNTLALWSACVDKEGNQHDYTPRYVNEAMLLDRITGWGQSRDFFNEYSNECEFLVIDELGMTQWNQTDKRKMEQLLNMRFNNGFMTVILSNLTLSEIFGLFSSQLQSRFRTGMSLNLTGADLRRSADEDDF